jgi:hypothetical protein
MTTVMRHKVWVLVFVLTAMFALLLMPRMTHGGDDYWLVGLTREVVGFQAQWGNFQPYVDQLQVVRAALQTGDQTAVYVAMNRFMDMLESRENGIAAPLADWLFDYCNMVTPVKFHDVSRHIRKIG